ncbi:CPBP family intramembrane glutamic endopeptidase [Lysinibacillus sp. NPDC097279]|uniref:CPBP family intramembrane glutamic endopeptidase n=1 Tax=Lysinibacillus sp. NPDC097279 TaxID=3364143 RepID=UPI0037F4995F
MSNYLVIKTTLCIYILTTIVHLFLLTFSNGRSLIGLTMIIPLLSVFLMQKIGASLPIVYSFAFKKPKWNWLLASIVMPILMGGSIHYYFLYTNRGTFLVTNIADLFPLLIIGLTISTFSALLEEIVWRGNFHFYLRQYYGLWQTACITGAIWSLWHLPIALLGVIIYLLLLYGISLILSLFREYGQSIMPVAILHGLMNVFFLSDGYQMSISLDVQEGVKSAIILLLFVCFFLSRHIFVTYTIKRRILQ